MADHRRCRGGELAELEKMPFIVRDMTDHEAMRAMKDSNKQRDHTFSSELLALLDLEVEDIKHQGGRLKNEAVATGVSIVFDKYVHEGYTAHILDGIVDKLVR